MHLLTDFSLWWLVPIGIISFALTYFYYQKVSWLNELSSWKKNLVKSLRFSSLFLIGLLLLGLVFEATHYRDEKPIFITLIDNSSSMKNFKDSSTISKNISKYRAELKERYEDQFELVEWTIGSQQGKEKVDFTEKTSNLEMGFEAIISQFYNRNVGGVALISDGNYNVGSNPSYAAEKLNLTPIFTLAVGDTTPKKDHYVKNVSANDLAYLNNDFPVEVDVEAFKLGGKSAVVSILHNGKTVASQNITYSNQKKTFKQLDFQLKADKVGVQSYTVVVSNIAGEYSVKNNRRNFYIEVVDARSKIILLSAAPHPDMSAFKDVLERNENYEVKSILLKDWDQNINKVDLVIWHEPGIQFDPAQHQRLRSAGIPILYVLGQQTDAAEISKLSIGLKSNSSSQSEELEPTFNNGFNAFELSEACKSSIDFLPPLTAKFGAIKVDPSAEILLFQRIGQIKKNDPLLFFSKGEKVKNGVIFGEGIWRWRLNDFIRHQNHDVFNEFIGKIANYLMVKNQGMGLRVQLPKRMNSEEELIVTASFYNASMEPITSPKIDFVLSNEQGKQYKSQFAVAGSVYKLNQGKLNPGKYNWKATTTFNGTKYSKSGVFIVEEIQLEKLESFANHSTLKQLSKQSNGSFHPFTSYRKMLDELAKRNDIATVTYEDHTFDDLLDYLWIFALLFTLLASEWFLRRYFGSY
ncbi:MAG: hypothetical protein RIS20_300 [Bacteroidota bacterium]|jgi:hypothetical protein